MPVFGAGEQRAGAAGRREDTSCPLEAGACSHDRCGGGGALGRELALLRGVLGQIEKLTRSGEDGEAVKAAGVAARLADSIVRAEVAQLRLAAGERGRADTLNAEIERALVEIGLGEEGSRAENTARIKGVPESDGRDE